MGMLPAEFFTAEAAFTFIVVSLLFLLLSCWATYHHWQQVAANRDKRTLEAKVKLYAYAARLQATPEDVQ